MGDLAGAHVAPVQSHHAAGAGAVLAVSAGECKQHEGGKITACEPGNIKVLWLIPAEAYWLSGDLGTAGWRRRCPGERRGPPGRCTRLRRGGRHRLSQWIRA
jgi:hypothetical protein